MNYTLHQLQIYIKIVQLESITKASEALFMTQPAVSIQLKNFQDQFDIPLYEVVGRKIRISEFGMEIYEMAEKIMTEIHAINYKTQAFKGLLAGRLNISVVSTGKYVMPLFLSGFMNKNSAVDLKMDVTNKSKVIQHLENNEIDFAFVSVLPESVKVNEEKILENEIYLIGNADFEINEKVYSTEILKSLPLIYREKGSGTRFVMESFLEKTKLTTRKKMELTSTEAVTQAVIAGLGFSMLPLVGIKHELNSGELKIIPVEGFPIKSEWRIIWLANKKLSPVAKAYLEYLRAEKESIILKNFNWVNQYSAKSKL